MRQPVGMVDHRRALGLDADPDLGARQARRREAEERRVGGVLQPHDARNCRRPPAMPPTSALSSSSTGMPERVRKSFKPKAGETPITTSRGSAADGRSAHAAERDPALDMTGELRLLG